MSGRQHAGSWCWLLSSKDKVTYALLDDDGFTTRHTVSISESGQHDLRFQSELADCEARCPPWCILGSVQLQPRQPAFNVASHMSDAVRCQYQHWVHRCLFPANSLILFDVRGVEPLQQTLPMVASSSRHRSCFSAAPGSVCALASGSRVVADVVVVVPHTWCGLLTRGLWKELLFPTARPRALCGWGARNLVAGDRRNRQDLFGKALARRLFRNLVLPTCADTAEHCFFDAGQSGHLAHFLSSLQGVPQCMQAELRSWTAALRNHEASREQLGVVTKQHTSKPRTLTMLYMLSVAAGLKTTKHVRRTAEDVCKFVLPGSVGAEIMREVGSAFPLRMPKFFDATKARSVADLAYMMCMRTVNEDNEFVRYLQVDSSPQGGRDFLNVLVAQIKTALLPRLFWLAKSLAQKANEFVACVDGPVQTALLDESFEQQRELRANIGLHGLPTVLLGMGRATTQHKISALVHAFRLECSSAQVLQRYVETFFNIAPDFGVESGIPSVKPFAASMVLQGWTDDAAADRAEANERCDFSDDEMSADDPVILEFDKMLLIPGQAHIVHNIANSLEQAMPSYERRFPELQATCALCRARRHRPRLQQTCFSSALGQVIWKEAFGGFTGNPRKQRFATTAFAVPCVRKVEHALRTYWDMDAFLSGRPGAATAKRRRAGKTQDDDEGEGGADSVVFAQTVNAAITSHMFWAWLIVFENLCDFIRTSMVFVNSCPCHVDLVLALREAGVNANPDLWKLCEDCPLKGRMGSHLATGRLLAVLERTQTRTLGCVLAEMPETLTDEERMELVKEYSGGASALKFLTVIKEQHWTQMPYTIFATTSTNRPLMVAALKKLVESDCQHPSVRVFQVDPVRSQALRVINDDAEVVNADGAVPGMQELAVVMAKAHFAWSLEVLGEGEHARTRADTRHAAHYGESFISFGKRWHEIRDFLGTSKEHTYMFAQAMVPFMRRGWMTHLGLQHHPVVETTWELNRHQQRKQLLEIVYHAHPAILYRAAPDLPTHHRDAAREELVPGSCDFSTHQSAYWRVAALDHIMETIFQNASPVCFSMGLLPGAVKHLSKALHEGPAGVDGRGPEAVVQEPPDLGAVFAPTDQINQQVVFLPVFRRPSKAKTVGGVGSLTDRDVGVSCHSIIDVDRDQKRLVFDLTPNTSSFKEGSLEDEPLLLSLGALTLQQLQGMWLWDRTNECVVQIPAGSGPPGMGDPRTDPTLRQLLLDILARPDGFYFQSADSEDDRAQWFRWLLEEQHVRPTHADTQVVVLNAEARGKLKIGEAIVNTRKMLTPRPGVDPAQQSLWELMLTLHRDGWEHVHLMPRSKPQAHGPGQAKVWFTRGEKPPVRMYLVCLLKLEGAEVKPFRPVEYYSCLLERKPYVPPSRAPRWIRFPGRVDGGDGFTDDEAAPEPGGGDVITGDEAAPVPGGGDFTTDDDFTDDEECHPDVAAVAHGSASRPPTSSDSSSSDSSSSASSSSAPPAEAARDAAGRSRYNFTVGPFTFTPKGNPKYSWQCACRRPEHNVGQQCTRTRNFKPGDEESEKRALWRLSMWALQAGCALAPDKEGHQRNIHDVEPIAGVSLADLRARIIAAYGKGPAFIFREDRLDIPRTAP